MELIAISSEENRIAIITRLVEKSRAILENCTTIRSESDRYFTANELEAERAADIRFHLADGCIGCLVAYAQLLGHQLKNLTFRPIYACDFPVKNTQSAGTPPFYGYVEDFQPFPIEPAETDRLEAAIQWFYDRYPKIEKGINFERMIDICIAEGILVERFENHPGVTHFSQLLEAQTNYPRYRMFVQKAPRLLRTLGVAGSLSYLYRQRFPGEFPDVSPVLFASRLLVGPGDTVERLVRRHYLAPGKYVTPVYGDLHDHLCEWLHHLVTAF